MTVMPDEGPLAQVREGMRVVDAEGAELGTVSRVQMGDPEEHAHLGEPGRNRSPLTERFAALFTPGSELTEQAQARLLRDGFVRVDLAGTLSGARYAEGGQVAAVEGDTVRLTVPGDHLLR